ncbi:MAG: hypothetical protein QM754_07500 [Tepidisphaeraceae bacterium]
MTDARLSEWLDQFAANDRDVAARVLDVVEFIPAEEIDAAFRSLLKRLPGWHRFKKRRTGKFVFVAFSRTAGESGDSMLHRFRLANNLNTRYFDKLFIGRSDLLRQGLGKDDTVVFLDDFVGSGNQAVDAWTGMFQELTATVGNVYLLAVAAFARGVDRIRKETRLGLLAHRNLNNRDSMPHDDCSRFSAAEKARIDDYCRIASTKNPWGYGGCGLVVVLAHQCPNNSLAILHESCQNWDPLFPRS